MEHDHVRLPSGNVYRARLRLSGGRADAVLVVSTGPARLGRFDAMAEVIACRDGTMVRSVVQPIVRIDDRGIVGYEALARVQVAPFASPDHWLAEADRLGLRDDLEVAFLASAVRLGSPPTDRLLFVNASPSALADLRMLALRDGLPDRLVLEITEQAAVDDYARLRDDLSPWLSERVRLAIDDTGAGYSSLRHVIELCPDFLKLDRTLVQEIDRDRNRQALVRALVAFAHEVGTEVIAEGVETRDELAAVQDAGVSLAQGFLLARPTPAWPELDAHLTGRGKRTPDLACTSSMTGRKKLEQALAHASDVQEACDAVVQHLFRQGEMMPSLYLERGGLLRCVAHRGLWLVLDGMPAGVGITGQAWATATPVVVPDVAGVPAYLEAVPGVVAEACVPLMLDGVAVGALNIDSLRPLPRGILTQLQDCAEMLSQRLAALGRVAEVSQWQRAAEVSTDISGCATEEHATDLILQAMLVASGTDTAALIRTDETGSAEVQARGALADTILRLRPHELGSLCHVADQVSSCYTGLETTGRSYIGSEMLRLGGARSIVILPLRAGGRRLGTLVLASSRPMRLAASLIEPLELLARHVATALDIAEVLVRFRKHAEQDGLTQLANRTAFDMALAEEDRRVIEGRRAIVIADVDRFKRVNDEYGHLGGDEALRALAGRWQSEFPAAMFYRFGGDEIIALVAAVDIDRVNEFGARICDTGRDALSPWDASVSVGIGVPERGESPLATLARADAALLRAKHTARGWYLVHSADRRDSETLIAT